MSATRRPLAVPIYCPPCGTTGTIDIAETVELSETFVFDDWRVPVCASCGKKARAGLGELHAMTNERLLDNLCTAMRGVPQEAKRAMALRNHERSEKTAAIFIRNWLQRSGLQVVARINPEYRHPFTGG